MRTRTQTLLLVAAVAIASLAGVASLRAQARAEARPVAVAVVNVGQVFDGLQERRHHHRSITEMRERFQNEQEQLEENIRRKESEMSLLETGSDEWMRQRDEIQRMALEYQMMQQLHSQRLENESARLTMLIYRRINDAVGQAAERGGYDLVVTREPMPTGPNVNPNIIQNRRVLYATNEIDISDQILQTLNNQFENRGN
jgi:Skp family chaperone for outer membrane proteins